MHSFFLPLVYFNHSFILTHGQTTDLTNNPNIFKNLSSNNFLMIISQVFDFFYNYLVPEIVFILKFKWI